MKSTHGAGLAGGGAASCGLSRPGRMTLRYARLADRDIEAAAERVGQAMSAIMAT